MTSGIVDGVGRGARADDRLLQAMTAIQSFVGVALARIGNWVCLHDFWRVLAGPGVHTDGCKDARVRGPRSGARREICDRRACRHSLSSNWAHASPGPIVSPLDL